MSGLRFSGSPARIRATTGGRSRIRRALGAVATTALLAAAGAITLPAGAAQAAGSSCGGGPTVRDYQGRTFSTRTCPTWTSAHVLDTRWPTAGLSGELYAGNNWVVCQAIGRENPELGGGKNNYWLYTQGDVAYDQQGWGWVPATAMSYGVNWGRIPGVPDCAPDFQG
ncbi:hypothetical protein [Streptomyces sp. NPDC060031]|uniref:hypothetical protein n=1 Tax=Streptomyces sp. NPDC060031 TaxID=3347043 RepID=UPI0036B7E163